MTRRAVETEYSCDCGAAIMVVSLLIPEGSGWDWCVADGDAGFCAASGAQVGQMIVDSEGVYWRRDDHSHPHPCRIAAAEEDA